MTEAARVEIAVPQFDIRLLFPAPVSFCHSPFLVYHSPFSMQLAGSNGNIAYELMENRPKRRADNQVELLCAHKPCKKGNVQQDHQTINHLLFFQHARNHIMNPIYATGGRRQAMELPE